ncbi:hypothetical protein N7466_009388 [Penicillium verhagenii]|uniref:uncharacterized protein n=1 Tax=Penicillium verhagenii TaxID=1562060 RepID=UPI002544F097|nr:uncharacterized protein N7466_009388 [Penicillium verhagenii]KAJ5921062.1 hypothetical protein N7466_009388 [Penicillium verhagenii]
MGCVLMLGAIMLFEYLISATALAFTTSKSNSRNFLLFCILGLAGFEVRLLSFLPEPELLRGVIAFSCIIKLLHFVSLFLVLRVEINQLVEEVKSSSSFSRFCAGLNCVTSTRGIGTPWEVKNVSNSDEPTNGKAAFIVKAAITLAWQYLVLDLLNFGALKYFHRNWPDALAEGTEFLNSGSTSALLHISDQSALTFFDGV